MNTTNAWALDPTANDDECEVAHYFDQNGVSICERFVLPGDELDADVVGNDLAACELCVEIVGMPPMTKSPHECAGEA